MTGMKTAAESTTPSSRSEKPIVTREKSGTSIGSWAAEVSSPLMSRTRP